MRRFLANEKVKRVAMLAAPAVTTVACAVPALAADSASVTALTTGFTTVAADMQGAITALLPIGLGVVGTVLAIKFGIKFFRGIAK